MDSPLVYFDNMAEAHPGCVSALLQKYGHKKQRPTGKDIVHAAIVHKDAFVRDLHAVHFDGCRTNYEGAHGDLVSYNGFQDYINRSVQILTGVTDAARAAQQAGQAATPPAADTPAPPPKRILGMSQTLFYVLLFVLVIIIAFIAVRAWQKG